MRSLADLEKEDVRKAFVDEAVQMTRAKAGVATAQKGFGENDGLTGGDSEDSALIAWFDNAKW